MISRIYAVDATTTSSYVCKMNAITKLRDLLKEKPEDLIREEVSAAMDFIVLLSAEDADIEEIRKHYHSLMLLRRCFDAPDGRASEN